MKLLRQQLTAKICIPLTRLKLSTIKHLYKMKNDNMKDTVNVDSTSKENSNGDISRAKKTADDFSSISVLESDARLLLNLSNSQPANNKLQQTTKKKPPGDNEKNGKEEISNKKVEHTSKKDQNEVEIPEIIILDDDNEEKKNGAIKRKLPVLCPVSRKKSGMLGSSKKSEISDKKAKNNDSQAEPMREVSMEDYNLLKYIKERRITRRQICALASANQENIDSDNNNNIDRNVVLEKPRSEETTAVGLDDETRQLIMNYSSSNKQIALKLHTALNQFESKRNEHIRAAIKHAMLDKTVNITNVINDVMMNLERKYRHTFVNVYIDKTTQTESNNMRDVATEMKSVPNNIFVNTSRTASTNSANIINKNVLFENQSNVIRTAQGLQIKKKTSPNIEKQDQILLQYRENPANTYAIKNYPDIKMMSALELTEPGYQSYYNNNWNALYSPQGVGATMDRQQCFLPTAATAACAGTASLPVQQSGMNNQGGPLINAPQPAATQTMPNCRENHWQYMANPNLDKVTQQKNQRVKYTPLRNVSPVSGPRFQALFQGNKYQTMIEQQRLHAMAQQQQRQQAWQTQQQNYPNAAWDYYFKRSY